MRQEVARELERTESMAVGQAALDAYLYGYGSHDAGRAGAGLSYHNRLQEHLSAFALGEAGMAWGSATQFDWRVMAGLRGVW